MYFIKKKFPCYNSIGTKRYRRVERRDPQDFRENTYMHDINTRNNIYVFAQILASTFKMMKQEELPHHGGVLGLDPSKRLSQ